MESQHKKMIPLQLCDCDKVYDLEEWKVEESNTLYRGYLEWKNSGKECEALPVNDGIFLNDITLFSGALDCNPCIAEGPGSLRKYYEGLRKKDRRALIAAAGKHGVDGKSKKLNAKRLTVQLLELCFEKEFIENNILEKLIPEREKTISFFCSQFRADAIRRNDMNVGQFTSFVENSRIAYELNGNVHILPKLNNVVFKGVSSVVKGKYQGKEHILKYIFLKKGGLQYHITEGNPDNSDAKEDKTIWMIASGQQLFFKTIHHSHPIMCTACSNYGRYIATVSENGQLMITDVEPTHNQHSFFDTILEAQNRFYYSVFFNNAGTRLLALKHEFVRNLAEGIVTMGTVSLWDTRTKEYLDVFNLPNKKPEMLFCNKDDSRLAIISIGFTLDQNRSITPQICFVLYDMLSKKELLNISYDEKKSILGQISSFSDGVFIFCTQQYVIVIDEKTGTILKQIEHTASDHQGYGGVICYTHKICDKLFIFLGLQKQDSCCIKVINYDTQECTTIDYGQNDLDLNHIGVSVSGREIFAIFEGQMMAKAEMYQNPNIWSSLKNSGALYEYLLYRLCIAKKDGTKPLFYPLLYHYIEQGITGEEWKAVIKKYVM